MRTAVNWLCGVVLFSVLRWAFSSFAWDTTVHLLQSFGIAEADLIAGVSSFLIPGILAFAAIAGAYNVGKRSKLTNAAPAPVGNRNVAATRRSEIINPFLIQAAIILAVVSGGIGYSLHRYLYWGTVDPVAIRSAFAKFHNYTEVSNRIYNNETVRLDGLHCSNCTFDGGVIVWLGTAPFILDNSKFVNPGIDYNIRTDNPIITLTVDLLHNVGALYPNLRTRGGHGPM